MVLQENSEIKLLNTIEKIDLLEKNGNPQPSHSSLDETFQD
jgi:hypothetical protein